jgi:hypothetical protein
MRRIYDFKKFEAISGTELVGRHMGPNYPEQDTDKMPGIRVLFSDSEGRMYTEDEYQDIYNTHLTKGGIPLHGFSIENLEIALNTIREAH